MKNSDKVLRVRKHLERLDRDIKRQLRLANGKLAPVISQFNSEFARVDPSVSEIPDGVIIKSEVVCEDIVSEWIYSPEVDLKNRILFIHGGGWCNESVESYRALAARISLATHCSVLLVKYRVPPKYPMPNGLSDCLASYTKILVNGPEGPSEADSTFLLADSTGANMSLALLFLMRERNILLPSSVVLLSPITDCKTIDSNDKVYTFSCAPLLKESLYSYLNMTTNSNQPLASPIYGILDGLPQMLIQVSEAELVFDDVYKFVEKATNANIKITLQTWKNMPHTFQKFAPYLSQANEAIENIGAFVRDTARKKIIPFPSKNNLETDNAATI